MLGRPNVRDKLAALLGGSGDSSGDGGGGGGGGRRHGRCGSAVPLGGRSCALGRRWGGGGGGCSWLGGVFALGDHHSDDGICAGRNNRMFCVSAARAAACY
jgi:hypothetical protein